MVNRSKVRKRVFTSWLHTIVAMFVMAVVMWVAVMLSIKFGGFRIVIRILMSGAGVTLLIFLLSEVIVTRIMRAYKPDPIKFPSFVNAVDDLCRGRGLLFQPRPRLYILQMGVPNACAFGIGFLGQYGIGITKEIYELLNPQELKAVLAHELAHIRCKDVGLMTVLVIITGGAEELAKLFFGGKTALGRGPFAFIIGGLLYAFAKFVFPIGRSAISQERELTADALGALYVGSPDPLTSALRKLEASHNLPKAGGFLSDLFISHPQMDRRTNELTQLKQ